VAENLKPKVDEAAADVDFETNNYQIELNTSHGRILIDLHADKAPGHCLNIIGLTKIGFYDGIVFHRIIKSFMNQAGCPQGQGTGGPGYTIDAEFNDTRHEPGVLSMARTSDPNSAGSQFFLCTATVSHLDKQYTAFGKTADEESLQVVTAIGKVPTGANDRPIDDVVIQSARVIETAK
jgi:cyclophilin family peptidyl-prolyl cis-trans isomerase